MLPLRHSLPDWRWRTGAGWSHAAVHGPFASASLSGITSARGAQEAYAKSLLVPRDKLAAAQQAGEVLAAHRILTDAYRTDVRPLLAQVRAENWHKRNNRTSFQENKMLLS